MEPVAQTYMGTRKLYVSGSDRVRICEDIGVMTEEVLDDDSIDDDAAVEAVYVMDNYVRIGGKRRQTFDDLNGVFGEAAYTGESYATLPELLVINRLNDTANTDVIAGPGEITETNVFTEYTQVDGYQEDYAVWLHSYEKDGLVYNFVSSKEDDGFSFYYILKRGLSEN